MIPIIFLFEKYPKHHIICYNERNEIYKERHGYESNF